MVVSLYLSRFSQDFHLSDIRVTTSYSMARYMRRTSDAKTGPNLITNYIYKVIGTIAYCVLANTSNRAQKGYGFIFGFNDCEAVFPPKGKKPLILLML